MALVVKDRVKETTTSTGTGTINLAGAATGFQGFVAGVGDGNTTFYAIEDANGTAWEVGIGTYTNSGTSLSRDTIINSSTGSKVDFSAGTKIVFCTLPAEKALMKDNSGNIVFGDASDPGLATKGFAIAVGIAL